MDTATFWHMIESAKAESNGDCDQQAQLLEQRLAQLPPEEIQSFERILWKHRSLSYFDDLWAAAFIAQGGCSDDGFEDFRGWLIAQGEAIFHSVLQNPDTLANIVEPPPEPYKYACIEILGVAWRAYEARTGTEMPQEEYEPYEPSKGVLDKNGSEQEAIWIDGNLSETYAKKHFPKLWSKFEW